VQLRGQHKTKTINQYRMLLLPALFVDGLISAKFLDHFSVIIAAFFKIILKTFIKQKIYRY